MGTHPIFESDFDCLTEMLDFTGKTIIVTGAGKGIGRGLTVKLVELGAHVIAISRTQADLDQLSNELGGGVTPIALDLADWEAVEKVVTPELVKNATGLVNNAAVARLARFVDCDKDEFDALMNINVKSMMQMSQIVAKVMIANGNGGSIVNISSQASQAALENHTIYCTTKAAVDQMTRMMALELGPHQIRSNCVNPTVVLTAMGKVGWSKPEKRDPMLAAIPLHRFCEVDDVVGPILFLLSDMANMVNGVTLPVDGGFLAT